MCGRACRCGGGSVAAFLPGHEDDEERHPAQPQLLWVDLACGGAGLGWSGGTDTSGDHARQEDIAVAVVPGTAYIEAGVHHQVTRTLQRQWDEHLLGREGHGETNNVENWNFREGRRGLHEEPADCGDGSRCRHRGTPPPVGFHHHPDTIPAAGLGRLGGLLAEAIR
ncbi:hypothetical protein O3P69_003844 [Scylla paramamosain]|uniref:Uncharacterized protein n=1 Tax=Scylla paramamosain TaxID=85552 RepID=A0AAW0UJ59_SCYPA